MSASRRHTGRSQLHPLNVGNAFNHPNAVAAPPFSAEMANATVSTPTQTEPKVAIPRLQRSGQKQCSAANERQRVSHACEPCRRRKSKCDGFQPVCSRCKDQELPCFYADGKREKLKRQVSLPFTLLAVILLVFLVVFVNSILILPGWPTLRIPSVYS